MGCGFAYNLRQQNMGMKCVSGPVRDKHSARQSPVQATYRQGTANIVKSAPDRARPKLARPTRQLSAPLAMG